jgi:hypothetical protein
MTFAEFIRQKGVQSLSVALSCPVGTIYGYSSYGAIPRKRWPDLLLAYPELGLSDLMQMEAAREKA